MNPDQDVTNPRAGAAPARMPVLFVGHGSPMNAIEDNAFSRAWRDIASRLPRPEAVLCVSAHWQTSGTRVGSMQNPRTIHDFWGFPEELYRKQYPAPGAHLMAERVRALVKKTDIAADMEWGLDHGAWAPLLRMYPRADIPVFQLSLDQTRPPRYHYELARELKPLRESGVLILGSGNIVHNLARMELRDQPFDWASAFDERAKKLMEARNHDALIAYEKLGEEALLSIPTNEHYLPMLYALALQDAEDPLEFFAEGIVYGSISMRGFVIGAVKRPARS